MQTLFINVALYTLFYQINQLRPLI